MFRIPRYWLLHALPFLFGLVDIIPYMLTSMSEKQAFMLKLTQNISLGFEHRYGFINQQWHYILKLTLAVIYLFAQWRLLFMADAMGHAYSRGMRFNLYGYTLIFSLFTLLKVGMLFNILFNRQQASYILMDPGKLFWISVLYLLVGIWLCVEPYTRIRNRN